MGLQDLIITPIYLLLLYFAAYAIRPYVTNVNTKKYFIPALTVKFIGAISLGFVYQFYYGGGDTFTYWNRGSKYIWMAFWDSPYKGLKLLLSNGEHYPETFEYSQHIFYFSDPASFFIVKLSSIFDLITLHTYSATALLFAVSSFSGLWAMSSIFTEKYPALHKNIAISIFFIPSVFFWGSGIMKDSVTIGALGWLVYSVNCLIGGKNTFKNSLILLISFYILLIVKIYILICILPAILIYIFLSTQDKIKSTFIKSLILPISLLLSFFIAYYSIQEISRVNPRYSLENIIETARITAYDIGFYTGKSAGSTYNLGMIDGTFSNIIQLIPSALNVSLFRPYIWEANNPLMILSSLESLVLLIFTIVILMKQKISITFNRTFTSDAIFCLIFSLTFAYAVGVSTFNFGTLTRYKIPLIPFYLISLTIIGRRTTN